MSAEGAGRFRVREGDFKKIALVGKLWWEFPLKPRSLWFNVIKSEYGLCQKGWARGRLRKLEG